MTPASVMHPKLQRIMHLISVLHPKLQSRLSLWGWQGCGGFGGCHRRQRTALHLLCVSLEGNVSSLHLRPVCSKPIVSQSPNFVVVPADYQSDPDTHVSVARKLRARNKRAVDNAMKAARMSKPPPPRRSRRLEISDGPAFRDMTAKAVAAKAARLNLDGATSELSDAVLATRLDDATSPPLSPSAARRIAVACGATADDLVDLSLPLS